MFSSQFVPNPYYTSSIKDFDLLGYSVTSGHFLSPDEIHYAAGATRGGNSLGKVRDFISSQAVMIFSAITKYVDRLKTTTGLFVYLV